MKRSIMKTLILFPLIFLLWGCQIFNSNKTLENSQEVGSNLENNVSITYEGLLNNEPSLKDVDLISDIQGPIEFEHKTGIYEGAIDERFIEMTFQKSTNEVYQEALVLSDDLINDFSSLDLCQGDQVYIEYYLNDNNQKVIFKIEKLKS